MLSFHSPIGILLGIVRSGLRCSDDGILCAGVFTYPRAILCSAKVHAGRLPGHARDQSCWGRSASPVQKRCCCCSALGGPERWSLIPAGRSGGPALSASSLQYVFVSVRELCPRAVRREERVDTKMVEALSHRSGISCHTSVQLYKTVSACSVHVGCLVE